MRYRQLMLASLGLLAATTDNPARAQKLSPALFTPVIHSGQFDCNVLNASSKTLHITVSILDQNGNPLAVSPPMPTAPGAEASNGFGDPTTPIDAYCKVKVSGTHDRNDLRVVLNVQLIKTFDAGGQTNIPVFIPRTVAGY